MQQVELFVDTNFAYTFKIKIYIYRRASVFMLVAYTLVCTGPSTDILTADN